jgi:hypothetical protein
MNERLKELELEAAYGNIDPNGPFTAEEFNQFTAKFAELIVQECIGIVKQRWINPDEDVIAEEIKQHFGIEE